MTIWITSQEVTSKLTKIFTQLLYHQFSWSSFCGFFKINNFVDIIFVNKFAMFCHYDQKLYFAITWICGLYNHENKKNWHKQEMMKPQVTIWSIKTHALRLTPCQFNLSWFLLNVIEYVMDFKEIPMHGYNPTPL